MNSLSGIINQIEVNGSLSLVGIKVGDCDFKSIVVETPETAEFLKIDGPIKVLFKETEVVISTDENPQISLRNKMKAIIQSIEKGKLLSKITMDTNAGNVTSIITTNAVIQLNLVEGSNVLAMVKTNEVLLSEC
jgi:molybdate transport system regulatory protein